MISDSYKLSQDLLSLSFSVCKFLITYNLLKEAHELGLQVFVWTPDSRHDMKRLIKMGVEGIITNRPDILEVVVDKDN